MGGDGGGQATWNSKAKAQFRQQKELFEDLENFQFEFA